MTLTQQAPTSVPELTPNQRRRKARADAAFEPRLGGKILKWIFLSLAAMVTFFPFFAMVVIALKPGMAIDFPGSLMPTNLSGDAFKEVLSSGQLMTWTKNTLIYSVVSVVLVLILPSMAGYAFAKKKFPGREAMFWSFLAMVMVPFHVTLIPTFIFMAKMGGIGTYWGLILPSIANAQAVFLMRQFIQGLPDELFEAAKIDGASEMRIFFRIVLPLCKPVLATLGVFVFLWHWNDFLWPMIVGRTSEMWTLTVGISSMHQQNVPLSTVLAGSVIALLPIMMAYLMAQRYFQEGVAGTGIKG